MFKKRFIPKIEYESCTFITDLVDRRYSPMINREKKGGGESGGWPSLDHIRKTLLQDASDHIRVLLPENTGGLKTSTVIMDHLRSRRII